MSRPVDTITADNPYRLYYLNYSPKYVMFSGWVGDQDSTFRGLKDALNNEFHSAW